MNKILLIGAVIVIAGISGWYVMKGSASPSMNDTSAQTNSTSGSGTIASVMMMPGTVKCEVQIGGKDAGSGTLYISNGTVRGDFATTISGAVFNVSMINDGSFVYTWMPNSGSRGSKIAASAPKSAATGRLSVDTSAAVSYTCSAWNADTSEFAPPSAIVFDTVAS